MLTWPALLFAPSVLLGLLSLNYALVEPSCHLRTIILMHGVSAASLAVSVLATLLAFSRWRSSRRETDPYAPTLRARSGFIAAVATGGTFESTVRDSKIESAIDAIGGDINSQYVISYRPTGSDSGYHQIRVTVDRPGVRIRTRPGYFLEGNK